MKRVLFVTRGITVITVITGKAADKEMNKKASKTTLDEQTEEFNQYKTGKMAEIPD